MERYLPLYDSWRLPIANPVFFLIKGLRIHVIQKLNGKSHAENTDFQKWVSNIGVLKNQLKNVLSMCVPALLHTQPPELNLTDSDSVGLL